MNRQNKTLTEHPDFDQILEAVRTEQPALEAHMRECEQCRFFYELAIVSKTNRTIAEAGRSSQVPRQTAMLPLLVGNWTPRKIELGSVDYDSWRNDQAAAVRDAAKGAERRLCLSSGKISLELVVEQRPEGFSFTARCYRDDRPSNEFILKIGRIKLLPDMYECYFWNSGKLPKKLQLWSSSTLIDFTQVLW
jgi:hypothetical protein